MINMNDTQFGALKDILKTTRGLLNFKYANRKRLNRGELWEHATMLRDLVTLEDFVKDETLRRVEKTIAEHPEHYEVNYI